jgi:hypothetical protein
MDGNRQQATGNRQQATGNRQQATGNRQQATGNRQQATGNSAFTIQSQTIDWLRFLFILFVVFIHATPEVFDVSSIDFSRFTGNDFNTLLYSVIESIASICNNGFFVFSGYLFFRNIQTFNRSTYTSKIKTRFFTLMIPYFLWQIIAVGLGVPQKIAGAILKGSAQKMTLAEWFVELKGKGVLSIFWDYNMDTAASNIFGQPTPASFSPYLYPFWFLQNLIMVSLLAPLFYIFIKNLKAFSLAILGALYLTGIWFVPIPQLSAVFFFAFGAYFGVFNKNLILELRKYKTALYFVTLTTFLCSLTISIFFADKSGCADYIGHIFKFSCTLSSMVLASYWVESQKIKANQLLTKSIFFVYALHTIIVLPAADFIFSTITRHSDFWLADTIRFPFVTVTTTLVCVGIYWFLTQFQYLRPIAKVLSGNR